jgi:hypothetical protein
MAFHKAFYPVSLPAPFAAGIGTCGEVTEKVLLTVHSIIFAAFFAKIP